MQEHENGGCEVLCDTSALTGFRKIVSHVHDTQISSLSLIKNDGCGT